VNDGRGKGGGDRTIEEGVKETPLTHGSVKITDRLNESLVGDKGGKLQLVVKAGEGEDFGDQVHLLEKEEGGVPMLKALDRVRLTQLHDPKVVTRSTGGD
jgi:hypothetical protein